MPQPDVLLIDACDAARYVLRLQLESLGATVRQAQTVEQALPVLRARRPDLIISAPALPGMNALDLLELLRLTEGRDAPPVIIHCPTGDWPLAAAATARGALAVVGTRMLSARLPCWLRRAAAPSPADRAAASTLSERTAGDGAAIETIALAAKPLAADAPSRRPRVSAMHCWGRILAAALLGLVVGLWCAAMLQP